VFISYQFFPISQPFLAAFPDFPTLACGTQLRCKLFLHKIKFPSLADNNRHISLPLAELFPFSQLFTTTTATTTIGENA